jgi:hypothetical protein
VLLACSVFAMLVFTNSFVGTGGLLLYTSIASLVSAAHWRRLQRRDARPGLAVSHAFPFVSESSST